MQSVWVMLFRRMPMVSIESIAGTSGMVSGPGRESKPSFHGKTGPICVVSESVNERARRAEGFIKRIVLDS